MSVTSKSEIVETGTQSTNVNITSWTGGHTSADGFRHIVDFNIKYSRIIHGDFDLHGVY